MKGKLLIECSVCGEGTYRWPSQIKPRQNNYCSTSCAHKGRIESYKLTRAGKQEKVYKHKRAQGQCVVCCKKTTSPTTRYCRQCYPCSKEKNVRWKGGVSLRPGYSSICEEKRRARKMTQSRLHYTLDQWENLKRKYDYMCLCCKKREPEIKLHADHIIPLSKNGTNDINNIQPLCQSCNSRKYNKTGDEYDFRRGII